VEPEVTRGAAPQTAQELAFERVRFVYEDGPHNAEGLLVDPASGGIYIVTKVDAGRSSSVYALPAELDAGTLHTALRITELPVPRPEDSPATSSASHPCGTGFALRTGNALYEFRIPVGADFADAFTVQPVALSSPEEPQSEAVTYRPDGHGILTTGEGTSAPLFESACSAR
jgi:hypothetical protein